MGSKGLDSMRDRLRKSFWCVASLFVLVDSCSGALLSRRKRQGGAQLDSVLDFINTSLAEIVKRDEAQDRIFIGSVQSLVTALQTILNDPANTPTALAGLATDPSNMLTLVTLVMATAFAAQISAFTLFGEPGASESRGLFGMLTDLISSLINQMESGGDDMEDGEMSGEDDSMEGEENNMDNEMEEGSGEGSGDGMESPDDMTEESQGGIIEAVIAFVTGIFGGNSDNNDMSEDGDMMTEEDGSGDMTESEGSGMDNERQEDVMVNVESDGGSSFGGMSVSFHPIDLAAMFVQVQEAVGMNCSCSDGAMAEEMVTNATLRLIEKEQVKKKRKLNKASQKTEQKKKKKNKKVKKVKTKRVPKTV